MRPTPNLPVEPYRERHGRLATCRHDGNNGAFVLPKSDGSSIFVIISDGRGWDHASVSVRTASGGVRTPTWDEMCRVKDLFFEEEECVVQFHPPASQYVNDCEHALHLWRPQGVAIPMPDPEMVGPGRKFFPAMERSK